MSTPKEQAEADPDSSEDSPPDVPAPKKASVSAEDKSKVAPKGIPPPPPPPKGPPVGGKPVGPPVDKDGKPIPPPPILDREGKEVPRPTDSQGNPLPIYVTKEGAPIFDENGKPIPLRFDKEGRPVPLQVPGVAAPPAKSGEGGNVDRQSGKKKEADKVPDWILWLAFADITGSILLTGYIIFELTQLKPESTTSSANSRTLSDDGIHPRDALIADGDNDGVPVNPKWYIVTCLILCILGTMFAGLPIMAVKKNRSGFIPAWCALCVLLLCVQSVICFMTRLASLFVALAYCGLRLVLSICASMMGCISDEENPSITLGAPLGFIPPAGSGYYPGQGQQISRAPAPVQNQVVLQQQPTTVTTTYMYPSNYAAMPYYNYGYPGYGYNYGMGLGMGLGYAAGYGMYGGYPYYGSWGWDGGFDGWW